ERKRIEANQMLLSYLASLKPPNDPDVGRAVADHVASRWTEYREPGPRIHVRPALIKTRDAGDKSVETAKCRVSVVADPGIFPPNPSGAYSYEAKWETFRKGN